MYKNFCEQKYLGSDENREEEKAVNYRLMSEE